MRNTSERKKYDGSYGSWGDLTEEEGREEDAVEFFSGGPSGSFWGDHYDDTKEFVQSDVWRGDF
jgi:hypothetical protein